MYLNQFLCQHIPSQLFFISQSLFQCSYFHASNDLLFKTNRIIQRKMQGLNNENEPRQGNASNNKKIFVIICIYLFLTLTSKYSKNEANSQAILKNKILTDAEQINLKDVVSVFELQQQYQGRWERSDQQGSDPFLSQKQGKFEVKVSHVVSFNGITRYKMDISIFNGQYVDKGVLNFFFYLDDTNFGSMRDNDTNYTMVYFLNDTADVNIGYDLQQVLLNVGGGDTKLEKVMIYFSLTERGGIKTDINVQLLKTDFSLQVEGKQNNLMRIMIFAGVLFIVSFSAFSSIMAILKSLYELHDNPRNYSLVTISMTCMWDMTLCIIAFIYAFSDQESLMLFIMPAFLLCLLFTNLQPRLMILIYQQSTNNGIREIICKFNLLHYGTLLLVYPILLGTNLGWPIFILMSCILFPQIYVNGVGGIRPELTSIYYMRYLLARMLIILYLRCFPLNIFRLQPDYLLVAICILLVALQYGLLYIQKRYGSKKVIPRFLLEPVFNYKYEEETNVEEGVESNECSICLTSLACEPLHDPNQLEFEPPFKLMRTPCNHNYHSRCLMLWMKVKMECPQCRYKLPPFE